MLGALLVTVLTGCGQTFFFAGRTLPPSGIANRVMVAIQNPGSLASGSLQILDAYYDVRHSFNNKTAVFNISGFGGKEPITIQNMPAEQFGAVYSDGDGSYVLIDYAKEEQESGGTVTGLPGPSSSIFISADQSFIVAANPMEHVVTVIDHSTGLTTYLNLPNADGVSMNPSGSVALIFVKNSNLIYYVLRLQSHQAPPSNAEDCEPQNLPKYCLMPVAGNFDRPVKAVFSPDGQYAYVLNCGPECGGVQSSVSYLPTAGILVQSGAPVPPGSNTAVTATVPVPGGATDALVSASTLYVAGQQRQSDGLLAGFLSIVDLPSESVTGTYSISDGDHTKMVLGDDSTLWIGSQLCSQGERFKQAQSGANVQYGCVTMFNTATKAVAMIDSYKGDATGLAAVTSLHKVYTAEGGQVYIYSTVDGHTLDNSQVTVTGTASAVAYMDAASDADNAYY